MLDSQVAILAALFYSLETTQIKPYCMSVTLEAPNTTRPVGIGQTAIRRAHLLSLVLALLGVASLSVDVPIAQFIFEVKLPVVENDFYRDFFGLFNLTEVYAHGTGVALILLGLFAFQPARWAVLPRIALSAYCAGLLAVACKMLVVRMRPANFVPAFINGEATTTFESWFPFISQVSIGWSGQSFPSAHAATATGLTVALCWYCPRASWYIILLGCMASVQRVLAGSHYPSDILFGAAIGTAIGLIVTGPGYIGRFHDRLERLCGQ